MLNNIKNGVIKFREVIWPLLEPLENNVPKQIDESQCLWDENEIDLVLEYIKKYSESEENRKKEIESKSIIFIGTFAVVATILINLVKDMVLSESVSNNPFRFLSVFIMTLAITYLCRAIWFSIKALERRKYYTLGFPSFMLDNSLSKKKQIVIRLYNNTKKNQDEINIKADYMTMAQEYFKRAILVVALFSSIAFFTYILIHYSFIQSILNELKLLNINQIIIGIIFSGLTLLFILVGILFKKTRNL